MGGSYRVEAGPLGGRYVHAKLGTMRAHTIEVVS